MIKSSKHKGVYKNAELNYISSKWVQGRRFCKRCWAECALIAVSHLNCVIYLACSSHYANTSSSSRLEKCIPLSIRILLLLFLEALMLQWWNFVTVCMRAMSNGPGGISEIKERCKKCKCLIPLTNVSQKQPSCTALKWKIGNKLALQSKHVLR